MSLINDALNRARAEAASKDAVHRGEIPVIEDVRRVAGWRHLPLWALIASPLAVVAVLAWLTSNGSEPERERVAETPTVEAAPIGGPQPGAEEALEGPAAATGAAVSPKPPATTVTATSGTDVNTELSMAGSSTTEPTTTAPVAARDHATADRLPSEPSQATSKAVSNRVAREPTATGSAPSEPMAEIRVATPSLGTQSQAAPSSAPTTIWPADGPDQETWYFVGKAELAGGGEIELSGIAWSELAPSAMLNGSLLTVGSEILGLRVVAIAPRTVTLTGQGQRIALQLAGSTE